MHHDLKLQTDYYQRKKQGLKPWELRSIADRDFQPGDTVSFYELDREAVTSSGLALGPFTITYVLGGSYGLLPGFVIFTHTALPEPHP